jgi:hypothetical protein
MTRFARITAPLLLALTFGLAAPSPSRAQPPEEEVAAEGGEGNPVPGYVATAFIGGFILFVVAKSARR